MNVRHFFIAVCVLCAGFASSAVAQEGSNVQGLLRTLSQCSALTDSRARLACYDAMAPSVRAAAGAKGRGVAAAPAPRAAVPRVSAPPRPAAPAAPPPVASAPHVTAPAAQAPAVANAKPRTKQEYQSWLERNVGNLFGGGAASEPAGQAGRIGVRAFAFDRNNKFVVVLDNGQVWRQTQGTDDAAFFHRGSSNTVTITPARYGPHELRVNDSNRPYPVARVETGGRASGTGRINATVKELAFDRFGKFILILDNGQVWQQNRGDKGSPVFNHATANTVTISRNRLGRYTLRVNDSGRVFGVTQVD